MNPVNYLILNIIFYLVASCSNTEYKNQSSLSPKDTIKDILYLKTFGKNTNPALIFLHGGPGSNSSIFERSTAKRLSDSGFFVITYDRRGEGRSANENVKYTFEQTNEDLNSIYKTFNLSSASLLGHSFGAIVAANFTLQNDQKVDNIIFVGGAIDFQATFKDIIASSKEIYQTKNDDVSYQYAQQIENLDSASIQYSSSCFMLALQNGFYSPKKLTDEAKKLYANLGRDTIVKKYGMELTQIPVSGFLANENYTSINISSKIDSLLTNEINIYGIYGKDDGLFSENQIQKLKNQLGDEHVIYLDDCSHSVYVDQQTKFIESIITWLKY